MLLPFLMLINLSSYGQQQLGFSLPPNATRVEVPFEKFSNLIVIPVTINRLVTLKFVLDTGAETAILTEKVFGDLLQLNYVREITLQAPGVEDSLSAYVASGVHMALPGGVQAKGMNMLVLKDDYLELSKNLGEEIYGILGYDVFSRFTVSIDYDANVLTLYDPQFFKPRKSDTRIPLSIENTKPFVDVVISQREEKDSLKLMVDSGASHSLLLDVRESEKVKMPKKTIETRLGQGLGGEIPGYLGRMSMCEFGGLQFEEVLASFPREGVYLKAIKRGSRHGTMGGDILSRLKVTFDYRNGYLYMRKGETYKDPFEFNMSGMIVIAEGKKLDTLRINRIMPNSPAAHSGLREGEIIVKINNMNLENSSISEINGLLRRKHGVKVVVTVMRNGRRVKKVMRLKRLI